MVGCCAGRWRGAELGAANPIADGRATPAADAGEGLPPLPELEAWLAQREQAFDDLRPDAAKQIRWADGPRRTPLSIVYLHGFSASRQEVAPLCERLSQSLGANLFHTRLTGHGRSSAAMAECSVAAWQDDAREALAIGHAIGERVILIGTSQGGALATWLACQPGVELHALILLSPNYGPKTRASALLRWPWAQRWLPWLVGRERVVTPSNEGHARHWTTTHPTAALFPMMELAVLAREQPVERVTTPLLMVYSPRDAVVDARRIDAVYERFGSQPKQRITDLDSADESAHLLAGDIFAPDNTATVQALIEAFLARLPEPRPV